jgi:hypothetical protein
MRATISRRLAESISKRPLNLREASAALLPPIPCVILHAACTHPDIDFLRLYRSILRAHRSLPAEMRSLGDDYVKAGSCPCLLSEAITLNASPASLEFRRHKDVTNPGYIIGFLSQWKVYLDQIPPVGPEAQRFRGKKLDPTIVEKVRSEMHHTSQSADNS